MESLLHLDILPLSDRVTCGPICLHAIHRYFGEHFSSGGVIRVKKNSKSGGTPAARPGSDALRRGRYRSTSFSSRRPLIHSTGFFSGNLDPETLFVAGLPAINFLRYRMLPKLVERSQKAN
jgi:hypothetical protein